MLIQKNTWTFPYITQVFSSIALFTFLKKEVLSKKTKYKNLNISRTIKVKSKLNL